MTQSAEMTDPPGSDELARSADLIERLLGDPELRGRFRTDPATVLREHGLPELAADLGRGEKALLTLELRESRSSLAGVMVAAAAEGVDFTHLAERAAPGLEHGAGRAIDHLVDHNSSPARHAAHPAPPAPAPAAPKPPSLGSDAAIPSLASPPPVHHVDHVPPPAQSGTAVSDPADAHQQPSGTGQADAGVARGAVGGSGDQASVHQGAVGTSHAHSAQPDPGDAAPSGSGDLLHYPGENAAPQQIAAWMGANAKRAGLPPELPVMASLVESTLHNLSYGDRDSVGFFQMRLGIWNNGPYAGYLQNPDLQIKWFIEHALEARAQDPALAQSPSSWGEWVANVEQPAAQYRYRYQLQLGTAQQLLNGVDLTPAPVPHIPVGEAALKVAMHAVGGSPPAGRSRCRPGLQRRRTGPVRLRSRRHQPARGARRAVRRRDAGVQARSAARRRRVLCRPQRVRAPRRAVRGQRARRRVPPEAPVTSRSARCPTRAWPRSTWARGATPRAL